MSFFIILW
jgi:hypothetical protein